MDLDEKATVRFETMPGKQGQMDCGFFEEHTVYEDGKWKRRYCFLLVLGCSRMRYIEFVTDMSTNILIRLIKEIVVHERIDEDKTRHISIEIHFNLKPIPEVEQVTA